MDSSPSSESVCVARSASDEARIEGVLTTLGLEYTVRLEASEKASSSAVCFMTMVYAVARSDADRARRALRDAGLGDRLLWPDGDRQDERP